MKIILHTLGLTAGLSAGLLIVIILLFFIKPLMIMGLIWILHNWCDFTLIPMLTFWQALTIGWLGSVITAKASVSKSTK